MKYKVGDKVKVRENLKTGKTYGEMFFSEQMKEHRGQIVTIKVVNDEGYHIEEDKQNWYWSDEMLEDVKEENTISEEMTIGQVIDDIMNNPDVIIKNLTKLTEECQKVNEDLKTKLKNKQSEIDFLRGQIAVYEKFLKNEEV